MCDYVSFLVTKEGRFYFGDLNSHAGIEIAYDLKPDSYREAEWVGNDSTSLRVRVQKGEEENWYKALILGVYKTRDALLKDVTKGQSYDVVYHYKNGKLHKDRGPAVTQDDGAKAYFKNDKLHRKDGPALITEDGFKAYYQKGKRHRVGGPAVIYEDGTKVYYINGDIHRDKGPAIIRSNGDKEYWNKGKHIRSGQVQK